MLNKKGKANQAPKEFWWEEIRELEEREGLPKVARNFNPRPTPPAQNIAWNDHPKVI